MELNLDIFVAVPSKSYLNNRSVELTLPNSWRSMLQQSAAVIKARKADADAALLKLGPGAWIADNTTAPVGEDPKAKRRKVTDATAKHLLL